MQGYAAFRAFERRCLRSSLAHGLIVGQSPMELGKSSNSSTSINVPVLDSRIKQTRIVTESCWLARDQAAFQVQTNNARDSHLYLLSKVILRTRKASGLIQLEFQCPVFLHTFHHL
jgi:hypothetical protein